MLMFQISRSPSVNRGYAYLDFFIFIKFVDIPFKLNDLENKL